ncbi:transcriptional regulator, AbrB family [Paenibacillus lactis 154]|uniref:Transcriptional regulator, AbrB family n=3 Tax=Paenibacillus lactis TaxID=228574 RepID=G4HJY5_9BACL|nr:transcriptional regulator, AbrB family [Paenibacillus lactis 154]
MVHSIQIDIMKTRDVKNMISMNLKTMRKLHRLTQEEVAEKIGVSRQAVAKWENGETVPDIQNCLALAELYDVVLDDLVKNSDKHVKIGIRPKGKHMFGMVKVGDRGQIVIPKKARDIFDIRPGDRLVVLGDEAQGIAILKSEGLLQFAEEILQSQNDEEEDEC